jgi:hypothetical protein
MDKARTDASEHHRFVIYDQNSLPAYAHKLAKPIIAKQCAGVKAKPPIL